MKRVGKGPWRTCRDPTPAPQRYAGLSSRAHALPSELAIARPLVRGRAAPTMREKPLRGAPSSSARSPGRPPPVPGYPVRTFEALLRRRIRSFEIGGNEKVRLLAQARRLAPGRGPEKTPPTCDADASEKVPPTLWPAPPPASPRRAPRRRAPTPPRSASSRTTTIRGPVAVDRRALPVRPCSPALGRRDAASDALPIQRPASDCRTTPARARSTPTAHPLRRAPEAARAVPRHAAGYDPPGFPQQNGTQGAARRRPAAIA